MRTFRNRKSGATFEVDDDRAHLFESRPGHYQPVDTHPCPDCDRTFGSPQALGSHSRSHDED